MRKLKNTHNKNILISENFSQAGQDLFVLMITNFKTNGTFLDIGAAHPTKMSNTYLLETEFNWSGTLVEVDDVLCNELHNIRKSNVICKDATTVDYNEIFKKYDVIDYISLDIDGENTLKTLKMLPINKNNVGIITFEHESYRIGDEIKLESEKILNDLGFYMLCENVCNDGNSFENWYINTNIYDIKDFEYFFSNNKEWSEIIFE